MGKRYREREERQELQAVIEIGSTSSDDTLRFHDLPIIWASKETKMKGRGKNKITVKDDVEVRGQDIFARNQPDKKTTEIWEKFLLSRGYTNRNFISLTNSTDRLTQEYFSYLINDYAPSDRYRNLDPEGQNWLLKVVHLAVKYHVMENKLAGYMRAIYDENDDEDYFCNEFALYFYMLMRSVKRSMQGTARAIHHIVREPDKAEYYLKKFFDEHYQQLRQTPFPQRDNILRLLKTEPDDDDNTSGKAVV